MKTAIIALAVLSLGACATSATTSVHQIAEKSDISAMELYAAIGTAIDAYEATLAVTPAQKARAEAIRVKAWDDLSALNSVYLLGQTVDLTTLLADHAAAVALSAK